MNIKIDILKLVASGSKVKSSSEKHTFYTNNFHCM